MHFNVKKIDERCGIIKSTFFLYIWPVNLRWYIAFLVVVLSVFGSISTDEQVAIPNQEIVLEFNDAEIDTQVQDNAITFIKSQLQAIGSSDIQVQELQNGLLKISYFSETTVEEIRALLEADNLESLSLSDESPDKRGPEKQSNVEYSLDVYEIQQSYELSDFEGQITLETKWDRDRSIHSNHNFVNSEDNDLQLAHHIAVAFKTNVMVAIAIENGSRAIPEVRAGPLI